MISKQLTDALNAISLLARSEQERLIAFLQGPPNSMSEPAKSAPRPVPPMSKNHKHWTDDEMLLAMDLQQCQPHISKTEYRRRLRDLAREMGRSEDAISRKIWTIKNYGYEK